jgi:hypothetical protein
MSRISEYILADVNQNRQKIRFAVRVTGRGRLFALLIKQTAGALDGFSVDVYSYKAACPLTYPAPEDESETDTLDPSIFQVIDTQTVSASASMLAWRESTGHGVPYVNHDITTRNRVDELYIQLTVSSPNSNKHFDVRAVYAESEN